MSTYLPALAFAAVLTAQVAAVIAARARPCRFRRSGTSEHVACGETRMAWQQR
jgi:hypothetical protein